MAAQAFMADFARRFACSVNVTGAECDSLGRPATRGAACVQCGECDRTSGEVGLAAVGVSLRVSPSMGLHLSWACPRCGRETVEETDLIGSSAHAEEALLDAECFICRSAA